MRKTFRDVDGAGYGTCQASFSPIGALLPACLLLIKVPYYGLDFSFFFDFSSPVEHLSLVDYPENLSRKRLLTVFWVLASC